MAKHEPIENIDPVYKYIDENVRQLKAEILKTQRVLADLQVRVVHNESFDYSEVKGSVPKFTAEMKLAFKNISTSENPLIVAEKFEKNRWNDLKQLGIKRINFEY